MSKKDYLIIFSLSLFFLLIGLYLKFDLLSLIASVFGVITTYLIYKKNIYNYFFGIINIIIYIYSSYKYGFFGDFFLYLFIFLPFNIFGIFIWKSKKDIKKINNKNNFNLFLLFIFIFLLFLFLTTNQILYFNFKQNPNPFFDSITTASSIIGIILMSYKKREQYFYWQISNLFSIFMWFSIYNLSYALMYFIYFIIGIAGYLNWKNSSN